MTEVWQQQLRNTVSTLTELCQLLKLDPKHASLAACKDFKLHVPRPFLSRMRLGDPNDPLLLQVLPQAQELFATPGYSTDPLQEDQFTPLPGLLHKYHGRVLLITSGACAINCRYCFRRHFPYQKNILNTKAALHYIQKDTSIYEVILSGGDPLLLKDRLLKKLIEQLEQIPHLRYLRLHTRLPVVIPERITEELANTLNSSRLKVSFVIHCNHPQELGEDVSIALKKLNVQLFNQSVLLKNINDKTETLVALSHRLRALNVLPYYLHFLDSVAGAQHFSVEKETALALMSTLQAQLPGYLIPKFVHEIPGKENKTRLA